MFIYVYSVAAAQGVDIYLGNNGDFEEFSVPNMVPGDITDKQYDIRVYHDGDIDLHFVVDVTDDDEGLGDELQLEIKADGNSLFSGKFSELDDKYTLNLDDNNGETIVRFDIVVTLPSDVTQSIQGSTLVADLHWYVDEEQGEDIDHPSNDNDDKGHLTYPPNVDTSTKGHKNGLLLLAIFTVGVLMIILGRGNNEKA